MKRILTALLLVTLGAAGALLVTWYHNRAAATPARLTLLPRSQGVEFNWPNDQAWTWTFPFPAGGASPTSVALRVREKESPMASDETPAIRSFSAAMPERQATRSFGTSRIVSGTSEAPASGTATIQLLDLAVIGAASTRPSQSLRLVGRLRLGPEVPIFGDDIYLPAGYVAGTYIAQQGTWNNNELYLMTFYVRGEKSVTQYDVFLQAGHN